MEPEVVEMNNPSEGSIITNISDIEQSNFESHFDNENPTSNTEVTCVQNIEQIYYN